MPQPAASSWTASWPRPVQAPLGEATVASSNSPPASHSKLQIIVDRSIVEVYANDRFALTARIYPLRPDSVGVAAVATHGTALLERLSMWSLEARETGSGRG